MYTASNVVPAKHFVQTMVVNVDNENLSDEAFREFVRNTLPIVEGGVKPLERNVIHVGSLDGVLPQE